MEIRDRSLFPLQWQLGILASSATPALADIVARLASELRNASCWTTWHTSTVCTGAYGDSGGVAAVAQGMSEHRHHAQVDRLLSWLGKAAILSTGR